MNNNFNEAKIVVKHSRIEINNYEPGDCPKLEYTFSIYDPVRHCTFIKGIEYDEETKKLILPRGIDIGWLENAFCCDVSIDRRYDEFTNTEPTPIKYLTRDEVQLRALKFTLGTDEYRYTLNHSQLSLMLTTGKGKTFVTIANICFTGVRAIIITSSINWLKQWKDKILEYTPIDEKQICFINSSAAIDKILSRDPLQYKFFLISHSTIKSYGDKHGWNSIDNLFKHLRCGLKVYDEAHLYFDNICKIDYHSNTYKTIYLSATLQRSNREEDRIFQLYFKNIPSIDLFDPETDPHTDYWAIHYNSHPSPMDIQNCKNAYGFDRNSYTNYVVQRDNFKMLTNILVDMALSIPGKILIFIGTNASISTVYDYMINTFPFLTNNIGIYTSLVEANKEENLHKKIILSTTKSSGTASDIYGLSCVINLAEPFKSPVLTRQTLGRTRADNTLYIDIVDTGFYFTKKYYESKKPIFSMYARSCKDIIFNDDELYKRSEEVLSKYNVRKVMCMPVFKK